MTTTPARLLDGRIAVVTGAATGIGAALVKGLAAHGASVAATGRSLAALQPTVAAARADGGRAHAVVMDVADAASCRAAAAQIAAELGAVSVLVNNAGLIRYALIDSDDAERAWHDTIDTNLGGPFNTVRAFLEPLKATRGAVVNITSVAGFVDTNNSAGYSASKGGIRLLTVSLARELGPCGVRVNAVAPGAIATRMSPSASDAGRRAILEQRVPLRRIGQPEDMVGPVVFLASEMSAYVTGTTLVADGGYLTS